MKTIPIKKEFPILEFDASTIAVIEPCKTVKQNSLPEYSVICFFREVIDKLVSDGRAKLIENIESEMTSHPIYEIEQSGKRISVFHPGVGAPLAAGLLESVIAMGCTKFIACGGAGVLDKEIAAGHVIVPNSAVRDEGTSYHYLAPSREVEPDEEALAAIKKTLDRHKCSYMEGKTWTTDAFFRETHEKVKLRKNEHCLTVEMETAALFAVAKFRHVKFGQILYGGDDVSCEEWDPRNWSNRTEIRERIFMFAVEACLEI